MALISILAQPPSNCIASQMRKYYCDMYTGQNIVCLEFDSLDELIEVIKLYIVPANLLSVYSYKQNQNPYKYGRQTIYSKTLDKDPNNLFSYPLPIFDTSCFEPFNNYRQRIRKKIIRIFIQCF